MSYDCPEKLVELYDAIFDLIAKPAQVISRYLFYLYQHDRKTCSLNTSAED